MPTAFLEFHEYDGNDTVVTYRTYSFGAKSSMGSTARWEELYSLLGFRILGYAHRVWVEDDGIIFVYKDRDLGFDPKTLTAKDLFLIKLRSKPLQRDRYV